MNSGDTEDAIITPSGIQIAAEIHAELLQRFGGRCCMPRCSAPVYDFLVMSQNSEALPVLNSYLPVCNAHSTLTGKLKSVVRSVRNLVTSTPETPSRLLGSRKALMEELVHQLSQTKLELRINYVGPLFCHPTWYHERRNKIEGGIPNFDLAFHDYLGKSEHSTTIRIVLRNAKRYIEKANGFVLPEERPSFKESVLREISNIWGEYGEKGPAITCIEMGFFRHPMIFDDAVIEIVRDAPERPALRGVVFSDPEYVRWERSNFDRVFEYSHRGQTRELAALREFVTNLWT